MADGKNINNIDLSDLCKICIECKQTRIPFQSRCSRLHRPYNLYLQLYIVMFVVRLYLQHRGIV